MIYARIMHLFYVFFAKNVHFIKKYLYISIFFTNFAVVFIEQWEMGRLLAIDYGIRRTGIAVTDMLRITAGALATVPTHTLLDWLADYFSKETVDEVVIGYPRQMSGAESASMRQIRPFMNAFRKRFPHMPLVPFDERFTSVLAHKAMLEGGLKKKARQDKATVDKIAACIILEDYLQAKTTE